MKEVVSTIKHPAVVAARRSIGEVGGARATAFLVEGRKLVSEALAAGAAVEAVFALAPVEDPADAAVVRSAEAAGAKCWLVSRGVFFRLLGLGYETAVRVLATVTIPNPSLAEVIELASDDAPVLVGERIQDPRNVGVLIRTVDGLGSKSVVFAEGSADPYSRQSTRSSTGSIFRVRLAVGGSTTEVLGALRARGMRIIGTSAGATIPCWEADLSPPCAIVVGNETSGLSEEAVALSDALVRIPMFGGAHSLNVTVAAGVLLYEAARQREVGSAEPALSLRAGR
ncbi:MAG: TrmH family RNA methyltransferase [Armatimonadota bacterium]